MTLEVCGIVPGGNNIYTVDYTVDMLLKLLGGGGEPIGKDAFVQFVLKRTAPADINERLRFAAVPRRHAKLDEIAFLDALILHALETKHFDAALIPSRLPETDLDVRAAIQLLAAHYNGIGATFHEGDVHAKVLCFSDEFRLQAKLFFQKKHPLIWQSMKNWLNCVRKPVLAARREADMKRNLLRKESMSPEQQQKLAESKRQGEAKRRVNLSPEKRKEVTESGRQAKAKQRANASPEKRNLLQKQTAQAQRNRKARKRKEQAFPSSNDDLDRVELPEPNWFHNAKLDAIKTLLLFPINSGHAYFPPLHEGRLPHSSECPAIMKETWDEDDEVPEDVRKLLEKIREQEVTVDELDPLFCAS